MKVKVGEYIIETDKIHYISYYGQDGNSYFLDKTACVTISFDFQNIEFKAYGNGFNDAYHLFEEWRDCSKTIEYRYNKQNVFTRLLNKIRR